MAKYLDKWKDLFPDTVGGTTRPSEAVSDQEEFNTDGFPQFIAQDPVNYALQNAFLKQFLSNDAWLWVKQKQANQALDDHKVDTQAHAKGISGNAGSATKLANARTINLSGAVTADAASFDGTADATINVKTLDASKLKGTASVSTTGNAATASKLLTPRTISLTGKAAGSTSFDGSANASINVKSVNADTASKLSTARKINITGNATGSTTFDGTSDVNINTTVNESKHATAADTLKSSPATETSTVARPVWLSWEGDNTKQTVSPNLTYTCSTKTLKAANFKGHLAGNADSATTATNVSGKIYYSSDSPSVATNKLFTVKQAHKGDDNVPNNGLVIQSGPTGAAYNGKLYITDNGGDGVWIGGVASGKEVGWTRLVENKGSWNINSATATKLQTPRTISLTGNASGSGTFDGSGNVSINTTVSQAAHAEKAKLLDGFDGFDNGSWGTTIGEVINGFQESGGGSIQWRANNGKIYQKVDGTHWQREGAYEVIDTSTVNNYAPTKTGSGASGTWGINISGTATNADKLDGYHASDLFRHLGGNQTPVITDIFDRAGTIDMSTMSAADKATHKANINKAPNMTQNIWNNGSGIHAYGGDADMAGYNRGTLKLTQSYKKFDKILVVGVNDRGDLLIYKLWDVWALANAFAGGSRFQLFHGSDYWFLYGSARKGTRAGYALSTDTVWSCQDQNSGIVAIYGIKY